MCVNCGSSSCSKCNVICLPRGPKGDAGVSFVYQETYALEFTFTSPAYDDPAPITGGVLNHTITEDGKYKITILGSYTNEPLSVNGKAYITKNSSIISAVNIIKNIADESYERSMMIVEDCVNGDVIEFQFELFGVDAIKTEKVYMLIEKYS